MGGPADGPPARHGRRPSSLRSRLLLSFTLVATGVLLVTGALAYVIARRATIDAAREDLRERADVLAAQAIEVRGLANRLAAPRESSPAESDAERNRAELEVFVSLVRRLLVLADARVVFVTAEGEVLAGPEIESAAGLLGGAGTPFALPDTVRERDLDAGRILAEQTVTGERGSTVFLARAMPDLTENRAETPVLLVTTSVRTDVIDRAGPTLLLAGAGALLVSVAVSLLLARRLTLPIRRVGATARRIASGDLDARVDLPRRTDREVADLAALVDGMAEQLEREQRAERSFLLSVSHDLRTPLTSIRGYAEALGDGTIDAADPDARAAAAAVIGSETRRLERLVGDLLDLSRLDSSQFSLHPQSCDAAAVVTETVYAFGPAAGDLGLALRGPECHTGLPVEIDAERLAQVVANLVENALRYARTAVVVDVIDAKDGFELTVTDDGPGIRSKDADHVFERLYAARSEPGRPLGSGLGLAIVRDLAQAMGGHVRLETPAGSSGARFVVTLPSAPAPGATADG